MALGMDCRGRFPNVRRRMQFGVGAGSHDGRGALGREIAEYLTTQMTYSRYGSGATRTHTPAKRKA